MWTSYRRDKFGVVIYNYDGHSEHHLQLTVGDTIQIKEQFGGNSKDVSLTWYRGFALKNRSHMGIFPASYVQLKECSYENEGSEVFLKPIEDVAVSEIASVLKEWKSLWHQLFTDQNGGLFTMIRELMSELIELRRRLLSSAITQGQMAEIKSKVASKIDWGNKMLGLDLVPRIECEPVNVNMLSPVDLFLLHHRSSASTRASSRGSLRPNVSVNQLPVYRLRLSDIQCTGFTIQMFELHFQLYDGRNLKPISEWFIIPSSKISHVDDAGMTGIFTDIGEKDMDGELFLIARIYKIGSLKDGESCKTPVALFKRPFGCAVQKINEVFSTVNDEFVESTYSVKVHSCAENEFATFHDALIRKQPPTTCNFGILFMLKAVQDTVDRVTESDARLMKNVAVTHRIGFADVILPGTFCNNLFVTLMTAELDKDMKRALRNLEVRLIVSDSLGVELQNCISPGSGERMVSEYRTSVLCHNNSPRWNETVRLELPVEQFQNLHIRFEFRHCSRKDRTEKKLLGISYLRLSADDSTTVCDGLHELHLHKCDDVRKLQTQPPFYMSLTEHCMGSDQKLNTVNALHVETHLCSTKFTQNVELLGLLRWKAEPDKVLHCIHNLLFLDGLEIMKFLQDVMDALFNMMTMEHGQHLPLRPHVFKALVHILNLLEDAKYEHFRPVMSNYIDNNFSAIAVHWELLHCLRESLEDAMSTTEAPSMQENFQSTFKVLDDIGRFIVQSRLLHIRAFGESKQDGFIKEVKDMFNVLGRFFALESDVIMQTQVILLQVLPNFLQTCMRVMSITELCGVIIHLLQSKPKRSSPDLNVAWLRCIKHIAKSSCFFPRECKLQLLPHYMGMLKHHLVMKMEIKQCTSVLFEVLKSFYASQQANVAITESVQLLLNSLLDVLVQTALMANMSSSLMIRLVTCTMSLLSLMTEDHYRQVVHTFSNTQPLSEFLVNLLNVFCMVTDIYPKDWLIMNLFTNNVILYTVQLISQTISDKFLSGSQFHAVLWTTYFDLLMKFITQPSLQLHKFSAAKQQKILRLYGDMRIRAGYEMMSMWQILGGHKAHFVPQIVCPLLEVTFVPAAELRKATLPILYDILECQQQKAGNLCEVEKEVINKLDEIICDGQGDDEYKQLFTTILLKQLENAGSWRDAAVKFVNSVTTLMERLLHYRSVEQDKDDRHKRMTCILKLLDFHKLEVQSRELYVRYVYKLYDLHVLAENHTEAGFTLKLHAELLSWSDQVLPETPDSRWPEQLEWQRKDAIYHKIIGEFNRGKAWEYGLPLCEELAGVYKNKILYENLGRILRTQSEFYIRILHEHRAVPTYFRVGFYGAAFPAFLQNKEFVYRGHDYEKLETFCQRLQAEFAAVSLLSTNSPPDDTIKTANAQYIQACCVSAEANVNPCYLADDVPDAVTAFYRVNDVARFRLDRPFYSGDKSTGEVKTMHIERTILDTVSSLPGIVRCFEVQSRRTFVLSPVEVAVDVLCRKNAELQSLIRQYTDMLGQEVPVVQLSLNPLTMALKGVVDPAVMGGIVKYQEAFLTDEFSAAYPKHQSSIAELKSLMTEQVKILEKGLDVHQKLASVDIRPLHQLMEDMFSKMVDSVKIMDYGNSDNRRGHNFKTSRTSVTSHDSRLSDHTDTSISNEDLSTVETPDASSVISLTSAFLNKILPKRSAAPSRWYTARDDVMATGTLIGRKLPTQVSTSAVDDLPMKNKWATLSHSSSRRRLVAADDIDSIRDTWPSSDSHPSASSSPAGSIRGPLSRHFLRVTEEESNSSNSVVSDSPPLPPKGSKLSTSILLNDGKLNNPPEIPRRLSVPHVRHSLAGTLHAEDSSMLAVVAAPQEGPVISQQSQKQSSANSTSEFPTEVSEDVAPAPLPRRPISQMKRSSRVVPEPRRNPTITTMSSDPSEASGPALLPQAHVSPVICQPDADRETGRTSPEAEVKPASMLPVVSDPGDSNAEEVLTPQRPVSEMTRNIAARASAASISSNIDTKSTLPTGKLVIPIAFQKQNSTNR